MSTVRTPAGGHTFAVGVALGCALSAVVLWLNSLLDWYLMDGWVTVLLGAVLVVVLGVVVGRRTADANRLGRGLVLGVCLAVVALGVYAVALTTVVA